VVSVNHVCPTKIAFLGTCVVHDRGVLRLRNHCLRSLLQAPFFAGKVLDASTTAWFVDLWRCCTDANDSASYVFSSNNWTMLGQSEILHVAGWATMLLLGHHMWASSEPPMVTVDKDKPCSWVGDVDYAFFRGLLGTSAQLLLVVPSALAVLQCFTTMGHDLWSSIALVAGHGVAKKCSLNLSLLPHTFS
jgi:hypothetical protein